MMNQTNYHEQRFNPRKLPDLSQAGPISASILSELRDPLRFLTVEKSEKTADMQWGTMVDVLWLTPEHWNRLFVTLPAEFPRKPSAAQRNAKKPSQATLDAIAWWDSWERQSANKQAIEASQLEEVRKARNMLDRHPLSRDIHANSHKQVIFSGNMPHQDPDLNGIAVKGMVDLLPMTDNRWSNAVVDLKQCHNVSEYGMKKAMKTFEYHLKMAWYRKLVRTFSHNVDDCILIFQNSKPPYDVHVRKISEEDLRLGEAMIEQRLQVLKRLDPQNLPALYDTEVATLHLADWMKKPD